MCCPYNFPRLVFGGTSGPRCAQDLSSPIDIQLPNRSLPNFGAVSKATAASFGGKGQRSLIEVGRENEAIPSSVMTVPVVGDNDRSLCATGIITGTYLDYATCAVVGLALANNNLSGTLSNNALPQKLSDPSNRGERGIRDLQFFDVSGNRLTGALPTWVTHLKLSYVALGGGNQFDYAASQMAMTHLIDLCLAEEVDGLVGKANCTASGLPPFSCDAFGRQSAVGTGNALTCSTCSTEPSFEPVLYMVLLLVTLAGFVSFATFAFSSHLRPRSAALQRWIACVSIITTHIQTLTISASIFPIWPGSIERVMACSTLSYSCVASPACISHAYKEPELYARQIEAYEKSTFYVWIFSVVVLVPALIAAILRPCTVCQSCGVCVRGFVGAIAFIGSMAPSMLIHVILRAAVQMFHLADVHQSSAIVGLLLLTLGSYIFDLRFLVRRQHRAVSQSLIARAGRSVNHAKMNIRPSSFDADEADQITELQTFDECMAAWKQMHHISLPSLGQAQLRDSVSLLPSSRTFAFATPSPPPSPPLQRKGLSGKRNTVIHRTELDGSRKTRREPIWSTLASSEFSCSFLTGRFSLHTGSYWQLLTWAMHFGLAVISLTGLQNLNHQREVMVGVQSNVGEQILLWTRCITGCAIVTIMWAVHTTREPYEFAFENVACGWLHASNVIFLGIGTFYSATMGDLRNYELRSVRMRAICLHSCSPIEFIQLRRPKQ